MNSPREKRKMSYGIILVDRRGGENKYLVIKRRDTYAYDYVLTGNWSEKNILCLMRNMTDEEIGRLRRYSFSELWDDACCDKGHFYLNNKKRVETSEKRFVPIMHDLFKAHDMFGVCGQGVWGFPKGGIEIGETREECAVRETFEETGVSEEYYTILDIPPIREEYRGTNGRHYATEYFVANLDKTPPIQEQSLKGIRKRTVSNEVEEACWLSLDEALHKFPYYRKNVIKHIDKIV